MTFVEIHAPVHQTQFVELINTNRFAHANKDTMGSQKFNVHVLDVELMTIVQQLIRASIDNVYQHAQLMEAHVVNVLNAMESITTRFVNVDLVSLAIQKLDAISSAAEVTQNVQQTKHVSILSAKAHAKRLQFANEMKFVEFTITNLNAVAHREQFLSPMVRAVHTNLCAEMIANVHHKLHA